MALSKRERGLFLVTIAVVVVVAQYLAVTWFLPTWRSLSGRLFTVRQELAIYRDHIARRPQWQTEYDALRGQVGERITQIEEMTDVLKKIEEIGQLAGVVITQRTPLPENDRGSYRELPVQCRLEATTESLVRFLYALRSSAGFVNVEQLQVQPQPNNASVLRCDILIHSLSGKTRTVTP